MAEPITGLATTSEDGDLAATPPGHAPVSAPRAYALSLAMVAAAAVVAFVVDHLVQASNLSLIFVLPVVFAAVGFGWGPSLISALLGVAVFNFLFLEPRFTFQVASPTDVWAMVLLLIVAATVSAVAARARRSALGSRRAADQAEALHELAHAVISGAPAKVVQQTAAACLSRVFEAPAVILAEVDGRLAPVGASAGAALSEADAEAAQWVRANNKPTRAETYPFDQAQYDFWPAPGAGGAVVGVKLTGRKEGRPDIPDRQVELVCGYLAVGSRTG